MVKEEVDRSRAQFYLLMMVCNVVKGLIQIINITVRVKVRRFGKLSGIIAPVSRII